MKAAYTRKYDDLAGTRWFDGAPGPRVAAQRHMGPVLVVVGDVLANQTEQMPLAKHDEVVHLVVLFDFQTA